MQHSMPAEVRREPDHQGIRDPGHEPLNASIGVAQSYPGATFDEVLSAADGALRAGKRAGGGIVVRASGVAVGSGRHTAP